MRFHRYTTSHPFARELETLRAFRGEYVGDGLLESLEAARLLIPRVRIRFPDPVARRFWLEAHSQPIRQLVHPVEPDGPCWDAAVELTNGLFRWSNHTVYGASTHPLDDPDPRFSEFIQDPAVTEFVPWHDMRIDVSSDIEPVLFDGGNGESYYNTWQVLLAAEVADAGVRFRVNLADKEISRAVHEALRDGETPRSAGSLNLLPVHAARGFTEHERALDAVVWYAEESDRALTYILKAQGGGRFRLTEEQRAVYEQACAQSADESSQRYGVAPQDLIALCQFLSERWSDWNRDGRPLIAGAYKSVLAETVRLTRRIGNLTFPEIRDHVGHRGGRFEPVLDEIWPDWTKKEQDRARRTLQTAIRAKNDGIIVVDDDIDAFVKFLAENGLEGFFWRLNSFEHHAFHGNEFALEGMKSDLQGMAVAVEHVVAALGGTKTQLYEKFKELWSDPDVLRILKRDDVAGLARQARLTQDWSVLKARIDALRSESGGEVAADLVMAHRVRGGVHTILPEDDEFELEGLFVILMRAALLTFIEVRRPRSSSGS